MRNGAVKRSSAAEGRTSLDLVAQTTSEFRHRVGDWRETLRREASEHPGRTTAIALGAGYLLGGGFFSPLTGRVAALAVKMAFRIALIPFVSQSLVALGESLVTSAGADGEGGARGADRNKNNTDQKETHP